MKRCPKCQSTYTDDSLNYCLIDGSSLVDPEGKSDRSDVTELLTRVREPFKHLTADSEPYEDRQPSRKEVLLRRSLDLVRGEADNGDAIVKIVRKALGQDLYGLVIEAVHTMSRESESPVNDAVEDIFEPKHWRNLPEDFAIYCSQRVLNSSTAGGAFFYFGDHPPEARSTALGYLGLYFLSRGDERRAHELWGAAGDRYLVDAAISATCDFIVEEDEGRVDSALALAELIQTKIIKAKIMSDLTAYI